MAKRVSTKEQGNIRYRLFGMCGTWDEYNLFSNDHKLLVKEAVSHLKYGYDAMIEDYKTGKVWKVSLKESK